MCVDDMSCIACQTICRGEAEHGLHSHVRDQVPQNRGWAGRRLGGRGLHSFTSQLNLSANYGIGGARRGCVAHFTGV